MGFITSIIGYPLGWVMWAIQAIVQSYGLSLLLFTVFSRLIMMPVTINQQKSSAKMALIQPEMAELRKKYAGNAQKMNEEMMALYQKAGYNPTSGCVPMLLQFAFLFGIIDVIYKPLRYILRLDAAVVTKASEILQSIRELTARELSSIELHIVEAVTNPATAGRFSELGTDAIAKITDFAPQLNFLGLNLMETPSTGMFGELFGGVFHPVILIPILSGVTSLFFSLNSMRNMSASTAGQPGAGSMRTMMLIMPVFSVMFTFSLPAGVGLYWIYSNVVGMLQNIIANRFYNPKEMAEKARREFEEKREQERLARIEAKKRAKELGEDDQSALSKKELNRRKLAEARKRDAEKYGEDYAEVTDDDLG